MCHTELEPETTAPDYEPPRLVVLGTLTELTLGTSGTGTDTLVFSSV